MYGMLRIITSVFVFLIFMTALSNAGIAPLPMDHLECYMVKDPLMVKEDVNLLSKQFGLEEDCKIIGKERFFCGGVNKTVDPPSDFVTFPDAPDRICYRIECPTHQGHNPVPPDTEVQDQFGIRTITNFNAHYLCTPAFKTGQSCNDRAACGGQCINETDVRGPATCRQLAPGAQDCLCVPDLSCIDRGVCGGPCLDPSGDVGVCQEGLNGRDCSCGPVPPDPCAGLEECGGECTTRDGNPGECLPDQDAGPCICVGRGQGG